MITTLKAHCNTFWLFYRIFIADSFFCNLHHLLIQAIKNHIWYSQAFYFHQSKARQGKATYVSSLITSLSTNISKKQQSTLSRHGVNRLFHRPFSRNSLGRIAIKIASLTSKLGGISSDGSWLNWLTSANDKTCGIHSDGSKLNPAIHGTKVAAR